MSESDVYRRQILTHKDGPRTESFNVPCRRVFNEAEIYSVALHNYG